jgi:hypothetical protein
MKRVVRYSVKFLSCLYFLNTVTCFGTLNFDTQLSGIRVLPGATVNVKTAIPNYTGTFKRYPGGIVVGQPVTVVDGLIQDWGGNIELSGIFSPLGYITLDGNKYLNCSYSKIFPIILINSSNNKIDGAPIFNNPVILQDLNSSVTLSIQSSMSQNIVLNGGGIFLEDDLRFVDDMFLSGSGTVQGNARRIVTGSNSFSITSTTQWQNESHLELRASVVSLSGSMRFTGSTSILGNGGIFDLSSGGKIVVADNTLLVLKNITIKGLGVGEGSIIFEGPNSRVRMSAANIALDSNITTTIGGIYVNSPSIWIVKNYDWTFDLLSSVTVDGCSVWKDPAGQSNYGDVNFIAPVSNHLTLISSGTLKFLAPDAQAEDQVTSRLDGLESCCDVVGTSTSQLDTRVGLLESCCTVVGTTTVMLRSMIDSIGTVTLTSQIEWLETCCSVVGTTTVQLASQITLLESCCSEVKTSTGELASSINVLATSTSQLDTRVGLLESCCTVVGTSTAQLASQITLLESCCSEVKTSTGELASSISVLATSTSQLDTRVGLLESCCTVVGTSTAQLASQITLLESCCSEVKTSTGELASSISVLATSTSQLDTRVGLLESCCTVVGTSTAQLASQITLLESCCSEVKTSTGELASSISVLATSTSQLDTRVGLLESCCTVVGTSTAQLASQIILLESCCSEVKTSTGELASSISVLATSTSQLDTRVGLLESCCTVVGTTTVMLRSMIDSMSSATLTSQVQWLESCCSVVGTTTGQLASKITLLESCCSEVETSTGELASSINVLATSTSQLDTRVGLLESCCTVVGTTTVMLRSMIDSIQTVTDVTSRLDILESCCDVINSRVDILESCCESVCSSTCAIHVSSTIYCLPSMLPTVVDNPAVVVFKFEPCWDDEHMPRVIFDASNFVGGVVDLVKDARIIFQGEGIVEIRDGITFNFGSEPLVADWPHIILEARAMMEPVDGATVKFIGLGKFKIRDAGLLNLTQASQVIFGLSVNDQFIIEVDASGAIIVNNTSALLTFQFGIFDISFSRSALLSILNGRVEFNSNNGVNAPGILSSLSFKQGADLEVQWPTGLLRLSPNADNSLTTFDNRTGVIDGGNAEGFGSGKMEFVNYTTGIDTIIRLQHNNFEIEDTMVELFLELGLLIKSDVAYIVPSDIDILVKLGDSHGTLAAIDPRRTGKVFALQDLDHDVAYQAVDFAGQGYFPIIGRDGNGHQFFIDDNGNRTTL